MVRPAVTGARLLDAAALCAAVWLGGALLFWSGYSRSFWMRPEHVLLFLLGIIAARILVAPVALPVLDSRRVLLVGVAAYALAFSFVTVTRHLVFRTHAMDLGYYIQLTWNLAHGHGPRVSLPEMNAWGDHLSPILYLFVPVFWVAPGAVSLLVGQSVALAAGAVAVFALAKRRLSDERPAAAFALLYLLNPSLHGINGRDFHAAALAIPLLLGAFYFAEAGRPWLFVVVTLLTLMCREDATLPVLGLGAWLAVSRRRWLAGLATAGGALVLLVVDVYSLIPHFRHEPYTHLWRYTGLGHSLGEIVTTMILHPVRTLAGVVDAGRLRYLILMLAPLGFLPLLGGSDLLGVAPALLENLLSKDPVLYNHRTQYQAFVLPFLLLAAIGGYSRLVAWRPGRWPSVALTAAFVLSLALASPLVNDLAVARWWPDPEQRAVHALLARVPAAAAVSAPERYVPHLSERASVAIFPVGLDHADYVLVDERVFPRRHPPAMLLERAADTVRIVVSDDREYRYGTAGHAGPFLLLKRLR
jgi:uncharacterized membrane protein